MDNRKLQIQAANEIIDVLVRGKHKFLVILLLFLMFFVSEEHNGIFEDLLASNFLDSAIDILAAYVKNPPSVTSTLSTSPELQQKNQLALSVCKILAQSTEGKEFLSTNDFSFLFLLKMLQSVKQLPRKKPLQHLFPLYHQNSSRRCWYKLLKHCVTLLR
jgi:hypothetical protein